MAKLTCDQAVLLVWSALLLGMALSMGVEIAIMVFFLQVGTIFGICLLGQLIKVQHG